MKIGPPLQNDGLIGPLRGGRDRCLRGELIVLLFCYSNGLLTMQSEARVAYTELLQSISLEVQDCTNELHLVHRRHGACYRAAVAPGYRGLSASGLQGHHPADAETSLSQSRDVPVPKHCYRACSSVVTVV